MKVTLVSKLKALMEFERIISKGLILPKELEQTIFEGVLFVMESINNFKLLREKYLEKVKKEDIPMAHQAFISYLGGLSSGIQRISEILKKYGKIFSKEAEALSNLVRKYNEILDKLADFYDIELSERLLLKYKRLSEKIERIHKNILKRLLIKLIKIGKRKKEIGKRLLKDLIKIDEYLVIYADKLKRENKIKLKVLEINLKERKIKYLYEMSNHKGSFYIDLELIRFYRKNTLQALASTLEEIFSTQIVPKRFVKRISTRFVELLWDYLRKNREITLQDFKFILTVALTVGIPRFHIKKAIEYIEKKYIKS